MTPKRLMPKRMAPKLIGDLLDRIEYLQDPWDLDLLLFFYRHPRAYLIGERLAQYVGYDLPQIARSLDTLSTAGLLRRSPHSPRPVRLYVLTPGSALGGWLSSLLRFAATREGRLAVIHVLKQRRSPGPPAGDELKSWRARDHSQGGAQRLSVPSARPARPQ